MGHVARGGRRGGRGRRLWRRRDGSGDAPREAGARWVPNQNYTTAMIRNIPNKYRYVSKSLFQL